MKKRSINVMTGEVITYNTKTGRFSLPNLIREKISEATRGEKHWNWKGGKTSENRKIRNSIEIRLWREAVFVRDNWICQKCTKRGQRLNAHHIKNFSDCLELRFEVGNGITFCKKCHKKFHKRFGQNNNNQKQIDKFLK